MNTFVRVLLLLRALRARLRRDGRIYDLGPFTEPKWGGQYDEGTTRSNASTQASVPTNSPTQLLATTELHKLHNFPLKLISALLPLILTVCEGETHREHQRRLVELCEQFEAFIHDLGTRYRDM